MSFDKFYKDDENEGLVAGTIMSIQEKKAQKEHHMQLLNLVIKKENLNYFYLLKFLIKNRDKLKESESFVITFQKDKIPGETTKKRINVKKIMNLEEAINKPYSKVTIELKENLILMKLKKSYQKMEIQNKS